MPDGRFRLFGLDPDMQPVFSHPLPGRGHAGAGHPYRPEAVAFARRPGTFALVFDCSSGTVAAWLEAPPERHFYGHGVFSRDGLRLYTTENAFEIGEGRIGIWDVVDGYRRVGEFSSGGIGPHEIVGLPGGDGLVIANGGIDTHPDTGRQKLNIATMRPNLTYVSETGRVLDRVELPSEMRMNSIRHLAVRADGLVAFGCQWQGDIASTPSLFGFHQSGSALRLLKVPRRTLANLNGYIGSVAFSGSGTKVAFTAPRGDRALLFDVQTRRLEKSIVAADICGVAASARDFVVTTGTGHAGTVSGTLTRPGIDVVWDNHLVSLKPL
jgi:hypothetical protein